MGGGSGTTGHSAAPMWEMSAPAPAPTLVGRECASTCSQSYVKLAVIRKSEKPGVLFSGVLTPSAHYRERTCLSDAF